MTDIIVLYSGSGWFWGRLIKDEGMTWVLYKRVSSDFPEKWIAEVFKNVYQEG